MKLKRLLFASTHSLIDPSSGAALATRDILELLAARGVDCRALCGGVLDYDTPTRLETVLEVLDLPHQRAEASLSDGFAAEAIDLQTQSVRITLLPWSNSRAEHSPTVAEARAWLDLADQALARFRPDVLLTYGGHPASLELMRRARMRKIAVVFHLHNFSYPNTSAFTHTSAVLVPSEFARRFYARKIGFESSALPYPLRRDRILAEHPEPRYVTFVNPQPSKGAATVFARIALELGRTRPDIPLLVVEGRSGADGLAHCGLDLSGLTNMSRMANTPDPRQFYRVSRVVLVPSLWRETFGRVAAEALANGLPVLASDRGALPETLGDAGFVLHIPPRCTPAGGVPSAREVAPWVAILEKLWDNAAFEREHCERARMEAKRWDDDVLAERYMAGFQTLLAN